MNSRQGIFWLIVLVAGPLWFALPAVAVADEFFWSEAPGTGSAPGLPGDYNSDGRVDAGDYGVWRKHSGTTQVLPNDPFGGTIGSQQYNTWRSHYGDPPGSGLENAGIPEPTSAVLLLIGTTTVALIRHRRGQ